MTETNQTPDSHGTNQPMPKSAAYAIASVVVAAGLGVVTYLLTELGIHRNPVGTVLVGVLATLCILVLATSGPQLRGKALNITSMLIGTLFVSFVIFVILRLGQGMGK
jgi:hypothetical protein